MVVRILHVIQFDLYIYILTTDAINNIYFPAPSFRIFFIPLLALPVPFFFFELPIHQLSNPLISNHLFQYRSKPFHSLLPILIPNSFISKQSRRPIHSGFTLAFWWLIFSLLTLLPNCHSWNRFYDDSRFKVFFFRVLHCFNVSLIKTIMIFFLETLWTKMLTTSLW